MPDDPYTADEYAALPEVLTITEVARILGMSEEQTRRWAVDGTIPAVKVGRVWRFSKSRIERFIQGE
jgi:PTS system nitrogen regulatory IIA component